MIKSIQKEWNKTSDFGKDVLKISFIVLVLRFGIIDIYNGLLGNSLSKNISTSVEDISLLAGLFVFIFFVKSLKNKN